MNPEFEKIPEKPERSFLAKVVKRPNRPLLSQAWHYHPEIEICYTKRSYGKRFVGNRISDYFAHDLVMFGSNLPHGFITDIACEQVVIQLNFDFLGREFLFKPELREVKTLIEKARCGLEFNAQTKRLAIPVIEQLLDANGLQQTIHLLNLLHILSEDHEKRQICSTEYSLHLDESNLRRIKIVYDHIIASFQQPVSISEVAEQLNLSESAFYKFIKRHTKKTYTEIINEFRINHASKLLISSEMSISQICFDSGFNNVSYFNRKFKQILGKTPHEFRADYDQHHEVAATVF